VASISVNAGSSVTILNIPAGTTILVTEKDYSGYDVSYTVGSTTAAGDNVSVAIEDDETIEVAFLNTISSGDLFIQKDVYINGTENNGSNSTFEFTLECVDLANQQFSIQGTTDYVTFNNSGVASVSVKAGDPIRITGLPIGKEIKITEVNYSGYMPRVSQEENGEYEYTDTITVTTDALISVYYRNETLYELPSTGSIGTYWHTSGGVVLMMASSLLAYKRKRREETEE